MAQEQVKPTILLCEDNEADIELTLDAFAEAQFDCTFLIARDGDEAIEILYKKEPHENAPSPDIVLLDLNMPRTDGKEVLKMMKRDPLLSEVKVVVLSSSSADKDMFDVHDLKATGYIVKPADADKFIEMVKQLEQLWHDIRDSRLK